MKAPKLRLGLGLGLTPVLLFAHLTGLASAAINLDGSPAVAPAGERDPSPIGDIHEYVPDRHDCPPPCADLTDMNTWIRYHSLQRLERCGQPMLMQLAIYHPLDDPLYDVVIRTCTTRRDGSVPPAPSKRASQHHKRNPQLHTSPLLRAQACKTEGNAAQGALDLFTRGSDSDSGTLNGQAPHDDALVLLQGAQAFFAADENCNENFLFARLNHTLVGVYTGKRLGKKTVESVLQPLTQHLRTAGLGRNQTIVQFCGGNGGSGDASADVAETTFGIVFNAVGNLAVVQKTLADWGKGICAKTETDATSVQQLQKAQLFIIPAASPSNQTNSTSNTNSTGTFLSRLLKPRLAAPASRALLSPRAACQAVKVESGDGCDALIRKCGISAADYYRYNNKTTCWVSFPGDWVCCSAGDPYDGPEPPSNPDGSCKVHDIGPGEVCDDIAKIYGVTVKQIEKWNKGKTWAWTECRQMQGGYNMCVSPGKPPLPRPQEGVICGPMKPGTTMPPGDGNLGLETFNPCPLKACCSNWGYCGVFPSHCDIHAPEGGGPGSKLEGFQNTCISNCGMELKSNSGPPAIFGRVGYYESWNFDRPCLWLKAKNANTDGSYTHIHWGFAEIDPTTFKVVIVDEHNQWADFKKLPLKRIVSFGGWAYSTEAPGAFILRSAIIDNRETFAANVAQFVKEQGIDGADIDWEYPGAPDIEVNGQVIGQQTDGAAYLSFLSSLRRKLPTGTSLSIAAPASYWYLKAFPIDRIAAVLDYIVYMTYDLHGQWDYGKPNSFDSCPSGKCIRSHVNLTETRNTLAMVMKAGVPGNKIFVGEASYGRSFRMAVDGCWESMCEFTGTHLVSDAQPGKCTGTSGYLGYAEIIEIVARGDGARVFHDHSSNTDVMLYQGDYIGYMTPTSKETRRADWKALNMAGTIDWAVDLQSFSLDDTNKYPDGDTQAEGEGCISGEDDTTNTAQMCATTCSLGYCPTAFCTCTELGPLTPYPAVRTSGDNVVAEDITSLELNRMCKFSCRFGYCPVGVCTTLPPMLPETKTFDQMSTPEMREYLRSLGVCRIYKDGSHSEQSLRQCKMHCQPQLDIANADPDMITTNYGCDAFQPGLGPLVWATDPSSKGEYLPGYCFCDNKFINIIAETVIEALPMIATIGCALIMSTLKVIVMAGIQFIPGVGQPLSAAMDAAMTAVDVVNTVYPLGEDPQGAFDFWLSPCGDQSMIPSEITQAFDILSQATGSHGRGSRTPKNVKDKYGGKGKKGDDANPPRGTKPPANGNNNNNNKKKCHVAPGDAEKKVYHNTLRRDKCVNDVLHRTETIITSISWAAGYQTTQIRKECSDRHQNACYHYSSVLRNNPAWSTLTCPPSAATTSKKRPKEAPAVRSWASQHAKSWRDHIIAINALDYRGKPAKCERDEYPPLYLLDLADPVYLNGGKDNAVGQLVRYIPQWDNGGAAHEFAHVCFNPQTNELNANDFDRLLRMAGKNTKVANANVAAGASNIATKLDMTYFEATLNHRPEFTWTAWGHAANPAPSDGLRGNPCWPQALAPDDPGFALLTGDPFYGGKGAPYDYKAKVNATPMPKKPGFPRRRDETMVVARAGPAVAAAATAARTTLMARTRDGVTLTTAHHDVAEPTAGSFDRSDCAHRGDDE